MRASWCFLARIGFVLFGLRARRRVVSRVLAAGCLSCGIFVSSRGSKEGASVDCLTTLARGGVMA